MALSLTIPGGTIQLSGNPIYCKVAGLSAPTGATNYQALLKITSDVVGGVDVLPGGPFIDAIFPDANGEALFDISGWVDQPFVPVFSFPAVGIAGAHPQAAWKVTIEFGEVYIDSNGVQQIAYDNDDSNYVIVLKGGISDLRIGEYNDDDTNFFEAWIQSGKFLTNQPNNAKVSPTEIVKLWYLSPSETTVNAFWNCTVETAHKAAYIPRSGAVDLYSFQDSDSPTGLAEFNVNPALMGFTMGAGDYVVAFTFWLDTIAGDLTERRRFVVDINYKENNNYLYVANSLGGVDVISLNGAVQRSVDINGTEGIKPAGIAATAQTRTILSTSRSGRRKWKINTGYKSAEEMAAMLDVYLSRNLWLYIDSKLTPVTLANGDKLLSDTMADVHAIDLEFLEAHNLRFS